MILAPMILAPIPITYDPCPYKGKPSQGVVSGQRFSPRHLQWQGFRFHHPYLKTFCSFKPMTESPRECICFYALQFLADLVPCVYVFNCKGENQFETVIHVLAVAFMSFNNFY